MQKEIVGIIGSGLIGRSWAMLFASAGYHVTLYDIHQPSLKVAMTDVKHQLNSLKQTGMLRGSLSVEEQCKLIKVSSSIEDAVKGVTLIQECIPEKLEWKKKLFADIDNIVEPNTIIASSTSSILPSLMSEDMKRRENFIINHPVCPPYYLRLVEIVPAPWTKPEVVQRTKTIMEQIEQKPVVLTKEIQGFVLNRIQIAILVESWRLVQTGILSAKDLDTVMSEGLGPRYAFMGPLITAHLNADGFENYCQKYNEPIYEISSNAGPIPKFVRPEVKVIADQLEDMVPLEQLEKQRSWRDKCLINLAKLKKDIC